MVVIMERIIAVIMIAAILITGNAKEIVAAYANESNIERDDGEYNDEAINELFYQREQLMLEMYNRIDEESNNYVAALNENEDYSDEFQQIDEKLLMLGVRKIDPSDPEDIAYLKELPADIKEMESTRSGVYDDVPDLSILSNFFDMYVSDGSVAPFYDGTEAGKTSYSYRVVSITDKKEGSTRQLYQRRKVKMLSGTEILLNAATGLLKHNFQILTDEFMGKFPNGTLLVWALENWDVFKNATALYADLDDDSGYTTDYATVTTMNYYYLYNPTYGWKLITTAATALTDRHDRFIGEVNARPINDDVYTKKYTMRGGNGSSLREYVAEYVKNMDKNPNYRIIECFGILKLKTYSGEKVPFEPKYADVPIDLTALANGSTY